MMLLLLLVDVAACCLLMTLYLAHMKKLREYNKLKCELRLEQMRRIAQGSSGRGSGTGDSEVCWKVDINSCTGSSGHGS